MVLRTDNQGEPKIDWLKWLLAVSLLVIGLVANYYYTNVSAPIRFVAWLAILVLSGFVASTTTKGKWVLDFFRDSRMELRKVAWPTREEVMQTTLVVAAMVIILAILLWGMDSVLVWVIGWLTGQKS